MFNKISNIFNNSSDLKYKNINNIEVFYLDSLCSSDKLNEYVFRNISELRRINLKDNISSPSIVFISDIKQVKYYLLNGYAFIYDSNNMIVCEVKGDLYRGINIPTSEASINGPKDSFNESILINLGLIKRRIKSEKLINDDYELGSITKNKISILYLDGKVNKKYVKDIKNKIKSFNFESMCDIEVLSQYLGNSNTLPTIMKTERPDKAVNALLLGKIVIIGDNSPYALILPSFFVDFINPIGDKYVNSKDVNFLKIIRLLCFLVTIILPGFYIAISNYSIESIPLDLVKSIKEARTGVPFPSYFECIFLIILCAILRESDVRFPNNYGSSISILGALVLGQAAVDAKLVSPIMIIIVGITFITGLIFNNGDLIDGLRNYRFIILILSTLFGLYGMLIGLMFMLINLCKMNSLNESYLYPLSPFNKSYLFRTLYKRNKYEKDNIIN